ncbi:hypothetical protein [Kitasatospora sp. NPDC059571]|uniref:hypothetical protein n=1 Tax=Kitasatospora sp. NPDC059571 TaxID=3346871 RepID=UPI003673BFAC
MQPVDGVSASVPDPAARESCYEEPIHRQEAGVMAIDVERLRKDLPILDRRMESGAPLVNHPPDLGSSTIAASPCGSATTALARSRVASVSPQ